MEPRRPLTILLTALLLAVAGCGGDDDEGGGQGAGTEPAPAGESTEASPAPEGGGDTLRLSADESRLAFDKDSLTAQAGTVTITMDNPSSLPHNVAIKGRGLDEKGEVVTQGGTSTVEAEVEPGTYTFYCSVDNHEGAGMKGTLTVD